MRNLLGGKSKDFITAVDEKNIIVVKELTEKKKDGAKELEKMAKEMLDMLKEDTKDEQIRIAYGTIISDIKEVSKSYKEAKLALDVGKIFLCGKGYCCIYDTWYRPSDLSAPDSVVQDVYQRDFRGEIAG